ncbi:MAG: hypothetical protein CFE44_24515 [Burkholderiales bacterium PBB4]|nr:MAG: hypothetical protein CFE44_24515 [Burkholderiales bacterium PBB4]
MASAAGAPLSADAAAVSQVVEAFKTAILRKDKAMFMPLFFSDTPEHITWQSVVDDASLKHIQRTRPQAIKARYRPDNNFVAFIDGIVASKDAEEEVFSDVQIDTDGEVASVSFDYVYLVNGKASNRGREKWLLVRTEQGWKITSVVYTIRLPELAGSPG